MEITRAKLLVWLTESQNWTSGDVKTYQGDAEIPGVCVHPEYPEMPIQGFADRPTGDLIGQVKDAYGISREALEARLDEFYIDEDMRLLNEMDRALEAGEDLEEVVQEVLVDMLEEVFETAPDDIGLDEREAGEAISMMMGG